MCGSTGEGLLLTVAERKQVLEAAIKANRGRGKIIAHVGAVRTEDSVELVVTDNGIGISKKDIPKIFDPFFTTKDVGSGTGLGLAVSFGILKRHNATISVDSKPGHGATFVVSFPRPRE